MRFSKKPFSFTFAAAMLPLFSAILCAENEVKVLAIGNSFTRDANRFREELNDADSRNKLLVTKALISGCPLEKHLDLALKNEADPTNPQFRQYHDPEFMPEGSYGLKDMLLAARWKYITIQQLSGQSDDIKTYRPYAAELCTFIKKYCPDAEIIIHETWADRVDNPRLNAAGKTQQEMYENLRLTYETIAVQLGGLRIIPVGDAFQKLRGNPGFKFIPDSGFDSKKASYPELPDQTHALCIGWIWKDDPVTGTFKLFYDHHANQNGQLLAALVWRQFFFPDIDVRKNSFIPEGMSLRDAKVIRETAYSVIKSKARRLEK